MKKIIVKGRNKLSGSVYVSTAKNSVLPIMAATILCKNKVIIQDPPLLKDVHVMCELLSNLGSGVRLTNDNKCLEIDTTRRNKINNLENELVNKMRASSFIYGPMLAIDGKCSISMPGGCKIGTRPIDLHLDGFRKLGANIDISDNNIVATADKLIGANIDLKYPSVGATENLIMASSVARGITVINNAAREPEILDLINFLNKMGACIEGQGTSKIKVTGMEALHGGIYKPIPDRIEASTFLIVALITRSKIKVKNVDIAAIEEVCKILKACGGEIYSSSNEIIIDGSHAKYPVNIVTSPYPGFPTDVQPQLMSLLSIAEGQSIIEETVFENRFLHANELIKMGAQIDIIGRKATINGKPRLHGAKVNVTDLRAGAAMILAGLASDGITEIDNIYHIDRGYVDIEQKFRMLGADIIRAND